MAKVLLVDTNFSSVPIYEALCELGHDVHVVGGNPKDCLAKSISNYWNIDYSDTEALAELVRRETFNFIVPGCTDRSYTSCVVVSEGRSGDRFPGLDTLHAENAVNNKANFRAIGKRLGLPMPQMQEMNDRTLRWPLIVKPVDAFSGKGITVIQSEDYQALTHAIQTACAASRQGKYLLEDFVAGQLHSHSAFICNEKIIHDFVVQEDGTVNPFVVDTSRVIFGLPDDVLQTLRASVEALASALHLSDGLLHTQFILENDYIWLIEMTRRCPGDLYSQLIELSTGFPYAKYYVLPFLGVKLNKDVQLETSIPIMRHTLTVDLDSIFGFIHFNQQITIERWIALSLVGDQLKPSPASRVGIVFAKAKDDADLECLYQKTLRRELYQIN